MLSVDFIDSRADITLDVLDELDRVGGNADSFGVGVGGRIDMEGTASMVDSEANGLGRGFEGCCVAGCLGFVGEVGEDVVGGERWRRR